MDYSDVQTAIDKHDIPALKEFIARGLDPGWCVIGAAGNETTEVLDWLQTLGARTTINDLIDTCWVDADTIKLMVERDMIDDPLPHWARILRNMDYMSDDPVIEYFVSRGVPAEKIDEVLDQKFN